MLHNVFLLVKKMHDMFAQTYDLVDNNGFNINTYKRKEQYEIKLRGERKRERERGKEKEIDRERERAVMAL